MEMGYKYFSLLSNYISSSFWAGTCMHCFKGGSDQDGALAADLPSHIAMSPGRLEEISPVQFLWGRSMPGNLSRACQSKKSHMRGEVIPPVPVLLGATCHHKCMHAWLIFMIVNHGIFIFTMIKFWSSCPNFLYLYPEQFVCGLWGCIWFCEPLHLYVISYLILWTIKFSL